ncbi:MAG: hypothetical protein PHV17_03385 [Candidatus Omnitrophica bacterium]|nr:hypothetical protein [Candidatus Omnitrophota bacterium]
MTKNPFDILRVGVIRKQEIIELFVKKRITFVCTGNTCRSPMGEMLLRKYIAESKPHLTGRYEIISRGISAYDGSPATANVVSLMNDKEGINARVFSAQRLDRQTVLSSDYIFCMEKMHRDYIVNLEPTAGGRTFTLAKFLSSKEEKDIPDPIGKDVSVYEHVYRLISEAVTELKDWL